MTFDYQMERREFMNLRYMPKLDLEADGSWSAHTYIDTFTLPNFQVGLSDWGEWEENFSYRKQNAPPRRGAARSLFARRSGKVRTVGK